MILDLTVLPYNLWKKDPVSQNIFKRCAGNFVEILIYGPKRTFENFWELGGKLESHVFAVCCPFMGLIHPKNGNFIEFDHFGSMGVLRRGSYRIGAHFWVFWKMLLCAHFPQGFFESKSVMLMMLNGQHGGSLSIFLIFSKISMLGVWRPFFRNRGQFTKLCPGCLYRLFWGSFTL